MGQSNCRHFLGYKPCALNESCDARCAHFSKIDENILIVHLGAWGAVLRSTALLPGIKRRFPNSRVTWVTDNRAAPLLEGLFDIDLVLPFNFEGFMRARSQSYSLGICVDKSQEAAGFFKACKVQRRLGFTTDSKGAVIPCNPGAEYLWRLGLSNHEKFFVNKKSEIELMYEAFDLGVFQGDPYQLELSQGEKSLVELRRGEWSRGGRTPVVGINTGCADAIPYKKLSIEGHRKLIAELAAKDSPSLVLLGGPTDTDRNREIGRDFKVIQSPTQGGLRDGLCSVAACDLVVTGDSLGMHMAIAAQKWVVAWFGPTCAHEIELYGRGVKIMSHAPCQPCWKRVCQKPVMCYDLVDVSRLVEGVHKGLSWLKKNPSSFKRPFLEMSF